MEVVQLIRSTSSNYAAYSFTVFCFFDFPFDINFSVFPVPYRHKDLSIYGA